MPKKVVDYDLVQTLYKQGLTDLQISIKAKCASITVVGWRRKNNLKPNKSMVKRKGNIDYAEVERLYNEGKTDVEIAEILDCSPSTIKSWRKDNDCAPNDELSEWIQLQVCS